MATYTHQQVVQAPREVVFDVLADRVGYPRITPLAAVKLVRPGDADEQGVGAVHKLCVVGNVGISEQVTLVERPARFEYKVVAGAPVRSHTGAVTLDDNGNGTTTLTYTMTSVPKLPAPAAVVRPLLKGLIRGLAGPIAKESARRASAR